MFLDILFSIFSSKTSLCTGFFISFIGIVSWRRLEHYDITFSLEPLLNLPRERSYQRLRSQLPLKLRFLCCLICQNMFGLIYEDKNCQNPFQRINLSREKY